MPHIPSPCRARHPCPALSHAPYPVPLSCTSLLPGPISYPISHPLVLHVTLVEPYLMPHIPSPSLARFCAYSLGQLPCRRSRVLLCALYQAPTRAQYQTPYRALSHALTHALYQTPSRASLSLSRMLCIKLPLVPSLTLLLIPCIKFPLVPSLILSLMPSIKLPLVPSLTFSLLACIKLSHVPFLTIFLVPSLTLPDVPSLTPPLMPSLTVPLVLISSRACQHALFYLINSFSCPLFSHSSSLNFVTLNSLSYLSRAGHDNSHSSAEPSLVARHRARLFPRYSQSTSSATRRELCVVYRHYLTSGKPS